MKTLLISGSPRQGNTEFILKTIYNSLAGEKELVLLRNKNIQHCRGCLACGKTKKCIIKDDMAEMLDKLIWADTIIIGTPNYYDNVSGLLKDFIDRTNPFYETGKLKNKKVFAIVIGGSKIEYSEQLASRLIKDYIDAHNMKLIDSFCFKALNANELSEDTKILEDIDKIVKKIEK